MCSAKPPTQTLKRKKPNTRGSQPIMNDSYSELEASSLERLAKLVIAEHHSDDDKARYAFFAREIYKNQQRLADVSTEATLTYGKWLVATLLLVPGGAFIAIFQSPDAAIYLAAGGPWLALGMGFAIACGFFAYLNSQALASRSQKWLSPRMLLVFREWQRIYDETNNAKTDPINATLYLATGMGFLSFWCLAGAASELLAEATRISVG